ncbi:glycerophosphodiester phosphodiesterase family protein [Paracoccus aminophilus]|uniref:Glycerophosphoryl diester phosphodiesterase n=1 Tax=Paracoccus aminophilus JCM 7686 TaxID=1367847 RepID=S5Y3J8_PARAH|nr:glycerophosphodiester phosphodiesterase family protein [Paracoccus aminophilus]AGT10330.1 glycerophosphoryl diester phosphodiesterase [Paracoccus aminophilus JCM 7686]
MTVLPRELLTMPVAHRGLHSPGVPENSLASFRAAIAAGYAIECDIQHTAEGTPIVFHDYDLSRMCGDEAFVADCALEELSEFRLLRTDEAIPTLAQMLKEVAGRVPLLIEIKDQDGRLGPNIGDLQDRVAEQLKAYSGPVAVMSFNPETVAAFHRAAPDIPVGLTTCAYDADEWPMLDAEERAALATIKDYVRSGSCFISHDRVDLDNPAVAALKAQGVPVLCWTIRSAEQEALARKTADNITFESYHPAT